MATDLQTGVATAGGAAAPTGRRSSRKKEWKKTAVAILFLAPALILLGALVVYPIFFTFVRSMFDADGNQFIGLQNYRTMFTSERTLTALRNNLIWVVFAPTLATILGLIFAVLTERIRWGTAFKTILFMPMAVSLLASGIIWRLVYELNPELGLANAAAKGVTEIFRPPGPYPGIDPTLEGQFTIQPDGAMVTNDPVSPGQNRDMGFVGFPPRNLPPEAVRAGSTNPVENEEGAIRGVVWLDFAQGGGGQKNVIEPTERGLPNMKLELLPADGSEPVATTTTDEAGFYRFANVPDGDYRIRLAAENFRPPFAGINWLGPTLVTPSVIISFLWIWAGFAMVVIGAGLSALPREVLEAARTDGANEWQVFRRITVPLLMPVLTVVLVTLAINVLKIFDLILIIPPSSSQDDATVIAFQMWQTSFSGRDQGLGSALAMFLFVLVLPGMLFNFKRFRAEQR